MFKRQRTYKMLLTVLMVAIGLCCVYPFLFMIFSAFKPAGEVLSTPFQPITENFTLYNFSTIFNHPFFSFGRWYWNTILMAGTTLILKMVIINVTAYGFSKISFPGRDAIFVLLLGALMIPSDIMIMPRYILFEKLGIMNTMWALVLPAAVDVYFVFLLRQAFQGIPYSLSEAAKIDGCNHPRICAQIIMPLCKASISTMLLFSFIWVWNDYMGPYLYIADLNKTMLSVGIKLFAAGQLQDYGAQMAATTVVLIPVIALFFFFQRYFVEGVTSGAVKG